MAAKFVPASLQSIDLSAHAGSLETLNGSLSIWFNSSDPSNNMYVFGFGDVGTAHFGGLIVGYNLTAGYGDESLMWAVRTSGFTRILTVVRNGEGFYMDGKWHHFLVVMDGIDNRIYVDGVKQTLSFTHGSTSTSNAFITTNTFNNVAIGRRFYTGSPLYMSGSLFDTRIYTSSLDDKKAKNIYGGRGRDGIVKGLKARYRLDGGPSGSIITSAKDISKNSYDGNPVNDPVYEASPFKVG
tara:strand:+ start:98 stop:817 length:720 start_codon:yes stop_codon:yes gene_type:complete